MDSPFKLPEQFIFLGIGRAMELFGLRTIESETLVNPNTLVLQWNPDRR